MVEFELLHNLGFIVVGALMFTLVLRRALIPNIVAYIIAGLALGPIFGILEVTYTLELIAEVGIILLLFLVGLELSIENIKSVGATAFIAGGIQMTLTAGGGFLLSYLYGFPLLESVFIGIAVMFSSTVVVIKLLETLGDIEATYGKIAVGVLLVQDIVVVIVLTFVAGLAGPGALELEAVITGLGQAFIGMAIVVAAVVLAATYVLPPAVAWISSRVEALFIWSICWCFLVVLLSELLNLSPEIGAFLAGVGLAQLPVSHALRREVHPLMNFFIVVFFVSIGIQMELEAAAVHWPFALGLAAFVMVIKPLIFFTVLPRLGFNEDTTFRTGITLAQISEFSLIFAALGFAAGLIDETILSLIALVGLVTFGLSSFLITYNRRIYKYFRSRRPLAVFGARQEEQVEEDKGLQNHVIIVGMNTMGRTLTQRLCARGETVLALDTDKRKLEGLPCETLQGDAGYDAVLQEAHLGEAKLLVSALQIEKTNNLLAYRCKRAGVPCSIHAFDRSLARDLRILEADHLIDSKQEGTKRILRVLRQEEVLTE